MNDTDLSLLFYVIFFIKIMCLYRSCIILTKYLIPNEYNVLNKCLVQRISSKPVIDKSEELWSSASDPRARKLYVWGFAETGALGEIKIMGKKSKISFAKKPIRKIFKYGHRIVDVSCGYGYTLYAVRNQSGNQLFGSGLNTDSQIGFQAVRGPQHPLKMVYSIVPIKMPLKSPNTTKVIKVAAGRAHSLALTDKEGVFSFGNNNFGQCARPIVPHEDYNKFKDLWRIKYFDDKSLVDVICGHDHSLFLTEEGKVYSCGNGADGQTGLGHYKVTAVPTLVEGDIKNEKIVKLSSTSDTVLAINDKGEIFGWGNNEYFQIPFSDKVQQVYTPRYLKTVQDLVHKIKDVASAGTISMILTEKNEVYVWGFGILGKGIECNHSEIPSVIPCTLFGQNQFNPHVKVTSINCGVTTLAAITNIGDLYIWGKNSAGQLGLGHNLDQYYPLKVSIGAKVLKVFCGIDHTMALCRPFI